MHGGKSSVSVDFRVIESVLASLWSPLVLYFISLYPSAPMFVEVRESLSTWKMRMHVECDLAALFATTSHPSNTAQTAQILLRTSVDSAYPFTNQATRDQQNPM